jgi:hypothetical protein
MTSCAFPKFLVGIRAYWTHLTSDALTRSLYEKSPGEAAGAGESAGARETWIDAIGAPIPTLVRHARTLSHTVTCPEEQAEGAVGAAVDGFAIACETSGMAFYSIFLASTQAEPSFREVARGALANTGVVE